MISLTLATAFAVRLMGAAFFTSGTVVVAIRISLALKLFDYTKYRCFCSKTTLLLFQRSLFGCRKQAAGRVLSRFVSRFAVPCLFFPKLANRAIIVALRPSPGLAAGARTLHPMRRNAVGSTCRGGL